MSPNHPRSQVQVQLSSRIPHIPHISGGHAVVVFVVVGVIVVEVGVVVVVVVGVVAVVVVVGVVVVVVVRVVVVVTAAGAWNPM